MSTLVHTSRTRFPHPAEVVFGWHERPGAFERLQPPWEDVRVAGRTGGIQDGSVVELDVSIGPLTQRWEMRHRGYEPGVQFQDEMQRGPFAKWLHTHRVEPDGPDASYLIDHIEYALPAGPFVHPLARPFVAAKLERTFRFRHDGFGADLDARRDLPGDSLRVAVTGTGGLIGGALVPYLTTGGHHVTRLVRDRADGSGETVAQSIALWDPATGSLDGLESPDAVVHLAGASVAAGRWNDSRKRAIRDSRVEPTRRLCEQLAKLPNLPRVLICASAIGVYGDRDDEELTETSEFGTGFLADVGREWEAATEPARAAGIRVVHLRLGVVLSMSGGALAKMLTPFQLGVGGRLGHGRQWMSWISLDDVLALTEFCLRRDDVSGPVNAVAPAAVQNRAFTSTLGTVLRRPTIAPAPAPALRLMMGEMADALLLASQRVHPTRALDAGFRFRHATLEPALRHLLGRQT